MTDITTDTIESLIADWEHRPNSRWRNKVVSALYTALAAAYMAELGDLASQHEKPVRTCVCPSGGILTTCPVHGNYTHGKN